MDRAAGQHCRERKAARRRKRIENGKRRHSPHRGAQAAERRILADANLFNLVRMTDRTPTLRIFAKRKPKLVHVPESAVLPTGFGTQVVGP